MTTVWYACVRNWGDGLLKVGRPCHAVGFSLRAPGVSMACILRRIEQRSAILRETCNDGGIQEICLRRLQGLYLMRAADD